MNGRDLVIERQIYKGVGGMIQHHARLRNGGSRIEWRSRRRFLLSREIAGPKAILYYYPNIDAFSKRPLPMPKFQKETSRQSQ
jgi:hypothetical protein